MRLPLSIGRHFAALRLSSRASLVSVLLAACGAPAAAGIGPGAPASPARPATVKVALLLPISSSGTTPAVAKALKQAAELALFDFDNPDRHADPQGHQGHARGRADRRGKRAARRRRADHRPAIRRRRSSAAAPVARKAACPMIAFSSDEKVAGNGVYLLSFLAGRDVPRIVSYAMAQGKRNFAELIPQSAYGRIAETAFARAVSSGGGQAAVRASFPPNDSTAMLGPVRQVATAVKSGQGIDALFLPAGRDDLPELAPLLASEDLSSGRVQFIGTGQWDYPNIGSDRALLGGWYPGARSQGLEQFRAALFQDLWRAPPRIASLAYDAISLAVSLSANSAGSALHGGAAYAADRLLRRRRAVPPAVRRHLRARPRHSRSARRRARK